MARLLVRLAGAVLRHASHLELSAPEGPADWLPGIDTQRRLSGGCCAEGSATVSQRAASVSGRSMTHATERPDTAGLHLLCTYRSTPTGVGADEPHYRS